MMRYILDSNVFVTPHRGFCPTDVGLSFWNRLKNLADNRIIFTIDKVKAELYENSDELKQWMQKHLPSHFFLRFESDLSIKKLTEIVIWAKSNQFYTSRAIDKFTNVSKADIFLVAFAACAPEEWTIVSTEIPEPKKQGEIKLPDACRQFGARCIFPQDMFRELHDTF